MSAYPPQTPFPPNSRAAWKAQRRAMKYQARLQRAQLRMQRRAMRRRSIVGPLVLVLLGVLFLLAQAGRLSWIHLVDWYARWWPLVLIAAGLVLVLEWAFDHTRHDAYGRPIAVRTLGGGVIVLLLLMAALGVGFRYSDLGTEWRDHWFGAGWSGLAQVLGEAHDTDSESQHPIAPNATLLIRNPHGDVTVTGTSTDGQIHITVHKQVWALEDSAAQAREQQLEPSLTGSDSQLTLAVASVHSGQADLTVTVPATTAVTVEAQHGGVSVDNLNAAAELTASHGDVDLGNVRGNAIVHMNHDDSSLNAHRIEGTFTLEGHAGDITLSDIGGPVSLQGDFFGTTHAERVRGPLRFTTSRTQFEAQRVDGTFEVIGGSNADLEGHELLGPIVLKTRNRNITLERVQGSVNITNRNGEVNITQARPLANIQVNNSNGSVNVGVAGGQGFTLNATTRHGDLENDFGLSEVGSDEQKTLSGSIAGGGPSISVTTTDGDVTIRKSSVDPLPPTPPAAPAMPEAPATVPHSKLPAPRPPSPPKPAKTDSF